MKTISKFWAFTLVLLMWPSLQQAQILDKLKNAVKNKTEQKADEGINKAVDKTEEAVTNIFKKKDKAKPTENSDGKQVSNAEKSGSGKMQVNSKYDFVPGEKIIFYEDFSTTNLGDFPVSFNTNGSCEVVTNNNYDGKWLKFVDSENAFWTETLLKLPENYTVEFDVIPIKGDEGTMGGYVFRLIKSINPKSYDTGAVPGKGGFKFQVEYFGRPNYRAYLNDYQGEFYNLEGLKEDESLFQKENRKYHIAIWVQKSRLRLYQDENKLFDIQKAFPDAAEKMDRIRFEEGAALISNIRIATGNPDMRNKLITEGKLVTYGIYFDVNKDVVKPESIPTLKEIAQVLSDNPTVRVKIVGHTDSDGEDAKNLDLSKRRGASVKKVLENTFGIQSGRLESDGLGETKPVAPNDNPSNKALNRRVEFVKL